MARRGWNGTTFEITKGMGPAVVLIHGLGLNRQSWQWQVPALARRYRVVTYDLFGHGDACDPPEAPSLALFAAQLAGLLDHLQIQKAAVLGFSLGGMIARRFAMDHQSRLWALGILHSAHCRDGVAQEAVEARAHQARTDGPAATAEAALRRWFSDAYRLRNPEMMDLVRGWILANRSGVYADIYQVLAGGVAELVKPRPAISAPSLVMTGDEDHGNSSEMSSAIAAEIPGSSLVILNGLRHMAMAEAPDVFNAELLSFLDRVAPSANQP